MSDVIADQFKDELNPDETIEWCGKPDQGLFFEKEDLVTLAPSLIIGLVVFFVMASLFLKEITFGGVLIVVIISSIFFIQVFAMIVGKLFFGPLRRKKTYYAITNQRIIIQSEYKETNIKSINLDAINVIGLRLYKNGKGTIHLGDAIFTPWSNRYSAFKYYLVEQSIYIPEFERIDEAKKVYELIKKLQTTITITQ